MKTKRALRLVSLMAALALLSACASGPKSFVIKGEGDPVQTWQKMISDIEGRIGQ